MNILSIDTSNQLMGVALLKESKIVGEYKTNVKKNHSVRLMPAIEQLLKDTETTPEQLDKIVVGKGPGSFTGVRIGLSTAKTMGWALKIPVASISSLEMLALNALYMNALICPFFDARRGLVYTGLYQSDENNKLKAVLPETNILLTEWLEKVKREGKKVIFLSPDIDTHSETIMEHLGDLAIIPTHNHLHLPSASLLAEAGTNLEAEMLHSLTPNYLRLAEAEAKWLEQQGKVNG